MKRIVLKAVSVILFASMLFTLSGCRSAAADGEVTPDVIGTILAAGTTQAFTDDPVPEEDIETNPASPKSVSGTNEDP